MAKRQQISVGLGGGREARLRALSSQHPFLKHLNSLGVVVGWLVDWAIAQLWKELPMRTIQQIVSEGLTVPGFPWSGKTDPLPRFAEEALLSLDDVQAILDGRAPTDIEASGIAGALRMDIEEVIAIIRAQYYPDEIAPPDVETEPHHDQQPNHRP